MTRAPITAQPFADFFERARSVPVLVVLGVQGAGTNLLRKLLVGAFGFSVLLDKAIVFNAAAALGPEPSADDVRRQFKRMLVHLNPSPITRKTRVLIKSNASYAGIYEHFDPTTMKSAADLALLVYAYGAYVLGTDRMAVKSDDLWEHIDQIDAVVPNRRVILLTRDFRDNLLSITRKDFGPIEPLVAANFVRRQFARYEAEYERTPPAHRLHVRYEDLLSAPRDVVHRFSEHFGLAMCPEGSVAVDRLQIRTGNTRKWPGLEPRQLAGCQGILRDELLRYAYERELSSSVPSTATLAMARGRDIFKRVPVKLLKIGKRLLR